MHNPVKKPLETKDTTAVYSNKSGKRIEPTSGDSPYNGFIIHGNLRVVTDNVNTSYGGLIGNNFVTDDAKENTNEQAFTAAEFLEICNFPVDVLIGGLVDKLLIQPGGKHSYHNEIQSALQTLKNATNI